MKGFIDRCKAYCLAGNVLDRNDIISLLDIPVGSADDLYMRSAAHETAMALTKRRGYIWSAVGMDYEPCGMNCSFCSFGEKWGLIKEPHKASEEEITKQIKAFADGGAAYIVLRTTELYDINTLIDCAAGIIKTLPAGCRLILNTGELDILTAERVKKAGVYGVYHALRLREGTDTPFDPQTRMDTMRAAVSAGLKLTSLVEPLGPEHTSEEIADSFLTAVLCGASISGVMARFPVPGTPKGSTKMLENEVIAHTAAALRLSGGRVIEDICVHPASNEALESGANVMVVEAGAIPRDADFSKSEWNGLDMARACAMLLDAGYKISLKTAVRDEKCPCMGGNLEKFIQPIILHILKKQPLNGYAVRNAIASYVTYEDTVPDMAATYRYLKTLKSRGLLDFNDGVYSVNESGKECLNDWISTIQKYSATLDALKDQLEK